MPHFGMRLKKTLVVLMSTTVAAGQWAHSVPASSVPVAQVVRTALNTTQAKRGKCTRAESGIASDTVSHKLETRRYAVPRKNTRTRSVVWFHFFGAKEAKWPTAASAGGARH